MEAARWAGGGTVRYWQQFCALDGDDQARIIAHYRAHERMQAVIAKDVERKRKRMTED